MLDLPSSSLDVVVDACAKAIVDVQRENLLNTFHGRSYEELLVLVKVSMKATPWVLMNVTQLSIIQ